MAFLAPKALGAPLQGLLVNGAATAVNASWGRHDFIGCRRESLIANRLAAASPSPSAAALGQRWSEAMSGLIQALRRSGA